MLIIAADSRRMTKADPKSSGSKHLTSDSLGRRKMYLLAILCPPLAVLMCGKPVQALVSIPLTLAGLVPGWIHAVLVVSEKKANERARRYSRYRRASVDRQWCP